MAKKIKQFNFLRRRNEQKKAIKNKANKNDSFSENEKNDNEEKNDLDDLIYNTKLIITNDKNSKSKNNFFFYFKKKFSKKNSSKLKIKENNKSLGIKAKKRKNRKKM